MKRDDPNYIAILKKYEDFQAKEAKARAYNNKLILAIVDMWQPIRGMNRTNLSKYSTQELIVIGKAMRALMKSLSRQSTNPGERSQ